MVKIQFPVKVYKNGAFRVPETLLSVAGLKGRPLIAEWVAGGLLLRPAKQKPAKKRSANAES